MDEMRLPSVVWREYSSGLVARRMAWFGMIEGHSS